MNAIEKFHEVHGECVEHKGMLFFIDGACRENSTFGGMTEPPENEQQKAKAILLFWKIKLNYAVTRFDEKKQALLWAAQAAARDGASAPPESELEELKALKKEVQKCQKAANEAAQTVEDSVPESVRQRETFFEEQRQKGQQFANKLAKIEV
jgi:hypothetical protein